MTKRKPTRKQVLAVDPPTLRRVVKYLDTLGLSGYGEAVDLKTGQRHFGCQDYDIKTILALRRLMLQGALKDVEDLR